jgi:anti-sigma B factor antagonist
MEAHSERIGGALVFFISGRLDAFGAEKLNGWIKESLHDDDRELVLDLTGSNYLSSGGLRTFIAFKKEMKRRNGRFILTGVGEYPRKVIGTAGFTSVLEIYPTVDEAVENIKRFRKDTTLFSEIMYKSIVEKGVRITIEPGALTASPSLKITGDIIKSTGEGTLRSLRCLRLWGIHEVKVHGHRDR